MNPSALKSWKTTVASSVSALASFVLFAQTAHYINFPQWAMAMAMFAQVGGLAAFGIVAKDANVTGGTVGQPSTPEALRIANQAPSPINPPVTPTAPVPVEVVEVPKEPSAPKAG